MPFKSPAQMRYMFANHPQIAQRFVADAHQEHEPVVQAADLDLSRAYHGHYSDANLVNYAPQAGSVFGDPQKPVDLSHLTLDQQHQLQQTDPLNAPWSNLNGGLAEPTPGIQRPASVSPDQWASMPRSQQAQVRNAYNDQQTSLHSQSVGAVAGLKEAMFGPPQADYSENGGQLVNLKAGETEKVPEGDKGPGPVFFQNNPQGGPGAGAAPIRMPQGGVVNVAPHETAMIDPKRIAAIQDAQGEQRAAASDIAGAQTAQAADQAAAAREKSTMLGMHGEEAMTDAQSHDDDIAIAQMKIDQASKELAQQKMDPDRWWKNQSTGSKILYGIANVLGAFANGYSGGAVQNAAAENINQHIAADLKSQQQEIESKRGRIADMQGLLADMYRRFGNMDQAKAAAHTLALQKADADAQEHAANSNSQLVQANAKQLSAQLKIDQEKQLAGLYRYNPGGTVQTGPSSASVQARAKQLYDSAMAGNRPVTWEQALGEAAHEAGLGGAGATADTFGKSAGGGKPNAQAVALEDAAAALHPGTGEDIVDRNLPRMLKSDAKMRERSDLANAARAWQQANHMRVTPAGPENDELAINSAMGRPTEENVAAFKKKMKKLAADTKNAASGGPSTGDSDE